MKLNFNNDFFIHLMISDKIFSPNTSNSIRRSLMNVKPCSPNFVELVSINYLKSIKKYNGIYHNNENKIIPIDFAYEKNPFVIIGKKYTRASGIIVHYKLMTYKHEYLISAIKSTLNQTLEKIGSFKNLSKIYECYIGSEYTPNIKKEIDLLQ